MLFFLLVVVEGVGEWVRGFGGKERRDEKRLGEEVGRRSWEKRLGNEGCF